MIYLKPILNQNPDSGNSYLHHFQIAHKNLMMVLQEQKTTQRPRPKRSEKGERRISKT
jgi:hypothetical protein